MPYGYLINGDYEREKNLQTIIEARCEVGHNFIASVGTDVKTIEAMSGRLKYALLNHYVQPRNFFGVGGMKIFRDLIWLMRGLMKADHEFFLTARNIRLPAEKAGRDAEDVLFGSTCTQSEDQSQDGQQDE